MIAGKPLMKTTQGFSWDKGEADSGYPGARYGGHSGKPAAASPPHPTNKREGVLDHCETTLVDDGLLGPAGSSNAQLDGTFSFIYPFSYPEP